ncbi:hypothetical protein [Sphingomonas solaris]|uniref:Uncharacterized protein n=1 Tax=Alterirhizorhabdus solaris TaxID=2529389 RepID=A0A558RCX7_9SPHN|nr:hypothetical protein [Sphingomonas solaris]TVV77226.1 hypothetical protein FOY91_01425 [Sphingomonas solaris]
MTVQETLDPAVSAPPPATFHDLMAGVGYTLFQWSMVEQSLDDEILELRRAAGDIAAPHVRPRSISERLGEWRALLGRGRRRNADQHAGIEQLGDRVQDALRLRNLVANGLTSAAIEGDEPVIRCALGSARVAGAEEVRLGMTDLLAAIDAMERIRADLPSFRGHGES